MTSTTKQEGGSSKRWHYSISLFSKMGDKGERGVKNLKRWVTHIWSFGTKKCPVCMNVLALDKRDHQQMFNGQRCCQLRKYIWSLDWLVFSGISSALFKQSIIWTYMTIRFIQIVKPVIKNVFEKNYKLEY